MVKDKEERQTLLEIVDQLKKYRTEIVNLTLKISRLETKNKMVDLEARRIESATILEIHRSLLQDGRPAYPDEWSKKARVEEILAKHERFGTLLKQHTLQQKHLARMQRNLGITQIKVDELESREKILVLT